MSVVNLKLKMKKETNKRQNQFERADFRETEKLNWIKDKLTLFENNCCHQSSNFI